MATRLIEQTVCSEVVIKEYILDERLLEGARAKPAMRPAVVHLSLRASALDSRHQAKHGGVWRRPPNAHS